MMKKKGEYAVSVQAKKKKAQTHWSATGAGSKHWETEGLMVWPWIGRNGSYALSSSKGHWTGNMGMYNDVMKERQSSIKRIVMSTRWKVQAFNFIAGTKSMNQEAWNKAMETIGVPKQKCDGMRERFMKVLLEEHETILSSYQAQKYGGREGLTGEVAQG